MKPKNAAVEIAAILLSSYTNIAGSYGPFILNGDLCSSSTNIELEETIQTKLDHVSDGSFKVLLLKDINNIPISVIICEF